MLLLRTLLDMREADLQTSQQHGPNIAKVYNQLTTSPRQPTGNAWKLRSTEMLKKICSYESLLVIKIRDIKLFA